MRVLDVFYVTYLHDLEWFQWSLASVKKNLKGFRKIVAVAPEQDAHLFSQIEGVEWHFIPDWSGKGYFWQQWVKMRAWSFTDAELIMHVDSDVMFLAPTETQELMDGDRPCWMWQNYSELPTDVPWQKPTEDACKFACSREFMRAFPFIVDRRTHEKSETVLVGNHGYSLEHYVRTASVFSEFNCMGAIAWSEQHDLYSWFNTGKGGHWPEAFKKIRQHWSHAPLEELVPEFIGLVGTIPILTDFGVWVIPGDTHLSKWIREHRRLDFDTYFLEQICKFIKGGDTVVDVGAFVGDHTLAYANMTSGLPGRVLAFEPNPIAFACLGKNMAPYSHVECFCEGLSDKSNSAGIYHDPNAGGSFLEEGSSEVVTKVYPLDEFKLKSLALMKIDAEGFEVKVLNGAKATIKWCRPILVIEVNEGALARQGTSAEELLMLLSDWNYEVQGIEPGPQYDITCIPRTL